MIALVAHGLWQSAVLTAQVLAVWALLTLMGLGMVLALFPPSAVLRWMIYAPLAGLAGVSIVALPLMRLGLPMAPLAPILAGAGALGTLVIGWRHTRSATKRHRLLAYGRHRWAMGGAVFIGLVAACGFLITSAARSDVRDIWGSSDFGAYWNVADFLQDNAATMESYHAQQTFHAFSIADHLEKHARLGCMVILAFLGVLLSPGAIHLIINPAIVVSMGLMLALAQHWLEIERVRTRWLLGLLVFHPFLYFLLYFSYASQAAGVVLFLAGLLVAGRNRAGDNRSQVVRRAVVSGILVGSAVLQHPSLLLAAMVFWGIQFVSGGTAGRLFALAHAAAAVLVSGFYLPQTLTELVWAARAPVIGGWNWRGLIGGFEFIGVRPLLGYDLPEPRTLGLRLLDCGVIVALAILAGAGWRQTRLKIAAGTILATTFVLGSAALLKYVQHVPFSSHIFVKTVSTFAIFIVLLVLLGVKRRLVCLGRAGLATGCACGSLLVAGQITALARGRPQSPVFTDDLLRLTRRVLSDSPNAILVFVPALHPVLATALVRDERRLAPWEKPGAATVVISHREPGEQPPRHVVAREGNYIAALP